MRLNFPTEKPFCLKNLTNIYVYPIFNIILFKTKEFNPSNKLITLLCKIVYNIKCKFLQKHVTGKSLLRSLK